VRAAGALLAVLQRDMCIVGGGGGGFGGGGRIWQISLATSPDAF